ncbi:MAG: hypothetical protein HYY06_22420 [Deltaproteobacteria bacterium]|nr:hypothetical protein [Deltaproteobacteria bacterium]
MRKSMLVAATFVVMVGCGQSQPQAIPGMQPGAVPGQVPAAPYPAPPVAAPVAPPAVPAPVAPPAAPLTPTVAPANPGDYVGTRMQQIYAQYGQGRTPVSPIQRGNLATSATQDFSVVLQAGHCYTVIGVGVPTVTDLDMFIFDPAGTQTAQDQATDNFPIVTACPSIAGTYRVQVKMYAGSGEFGVQVFGT